MTQSRDDEDRRRQPAEAVELVVPVICGCPDGERRHLYLIRLSRGGAFVLSLRPPSPGSVLTLHIEPPGCPPITGVEALVIGQRVDPGDAARTGFEVLFTRLSEPAREALGSALESLENLRAPALEVVPAPRCRAEQRRAPRVPTLLRGVLALQPEPLPVEVVNLSLSGALLGLGAAACPLRPGDLAELSIVAPAAPEAVTVRTRVVRLSSDPRGLGVCFLSLEPQVERRVEGLIIDALGRTLSGKA